MSETKTLHLMPIDDYSNAKKTMPRLPGEAWRGWVRDPYDRRSMMLCAVALCLGRPFVYRVLPHTPESDAWVPAFDALVIDALAAWGLHEKSCADAWRAYHAARLTAEHLTVAGGRTSDDGRDADEAKDKLKMAHDALRVLGEKV